MFSVISKERFRYALQQVERLFEHYPGIPWILVGNKVDLLEDKETLLQYEESRIRPIPFEYV